MNNPELLIFDIDNTLLTPSYYMNLNDIRNGLYDLNLLKSFVNSNKYQIGIASLNHDLYESEKGAPLFGYRLARAILDSVYLNGNSNSSIEPDFIQAWRNLEYPEFLKEKHLRKIIHAYFKKYNAYPPRIIYYDDQIEQIHMANKLGIKAYWCPEGLTRNNIDHLIRITEKIQFKLVGDYSNINGYNFHIILPFLRYNNAEDYFDFYFNNYGQVNILIELFTKNNLIMLDLPR